MDVGVNKYLKLLTDKLQFWISKGVKLIPNFIAAVIVLLIFFGIGWLIREAVKKTLHKITSNQAVIDLLETVAGIVVVGIGIFVALEIMKLSKAVTTLLAGASVVGLALGFAFRDIAANLISGIILSFRHPFGINDLLKTENHYGYVHKINMRCTVIRTVQGQLVYLPNKDVLNEPFINFSWNNKRRIDLSCRCSYGDDLDDVQDLAVKAVKELGIHVASQPVQAMFKEFGSHSVNFDVRSWVTFKKQLDFIKKRSEAIKAISKKFDEHDVMIPYPTRTLDFDVKKGAKLDDVLNKSGKIE